MLQMNFEVVLYMLLSGTQLFRDSDAEALKLKIMTGQYQEMSGVRWGCHIRECQGPCDPVVGGGPKVKDECKEYITQVVKFFFKHSLPPPLVLIMQVAATAINIIKI